MKEKLQKKQYDKLAKIFSKEQNTNNQVNRLCTYKLIDFSLKNKKILDAGCGDGTDLAYLNKKGGNVYGIDISKEILKIAQEKCPTAILKKCDFSKMPFKNNFFDFVYSKYAFQHEYKIEPIIKEINRILRKDGIIIFLVTHPIRQFIEKKKAGKDYFKQEVVHSLILDNTIIVDEPSHTFSDYFSKFFFNHFEVLDFIEKFDPAAEQINKDVYPGFMVIKARKK